MTFPNPPADPTVNEEHSQGGKTWKWDGEKWNLKFNDQTTFTDEVFLQSDRSFIEDLYQDTLETDTKPLIPNQESTNIALTEIIRNLKGSNVIIGEFPPGTPDAYGNADVPEVGDLWIYDGTMTLFAYDGDQWVEVNGSCGASDVKDIGEIVITGPNRLFTVFKGVPHTYSASVEDTNGVTFTWTTSDGEDVLSSTTGDSVEITWTSAGNKSVTVTATRAGASDNGRKKVYNETALAYTIGSLSIDSSRSQGIPISSSPGQSSIWNTLSVETNGSNVNDMTYAWTCTSANASDLVFKYGETDGQSTDVIADVDGTYTIECAITSDKVAGVSGDELTPKTQTITLDTYTPVTMRPVSISGPTDVTINTPFTLEAVSDGNISPDNLTYYWLYDTVPGGFTWDSDRDQKTVTITPSAAGNYKFKCNIGTTITPEEEPNWDGTTLIAARITVTSS